MTLGNKIASLRKQRSLTQEALAQKLEVTNQAVSKWEADTCCPDIQLLPKIADIFGITLDELFDREPKTKPADLPWEDDSTLRVVLYVGKNLIGGHPATEELQFCYEGPALNIHSQISVTCGDVDGNVSANGNVTCDDVEGNIQAGGNVTCDDVDGNIHAGRDVTCDCIEGDVFAGRDIQCDEAEGTLQAGGSIYCDHFEGQFG